MYNNIIKRPLPSLFWLWFQSLRRSFRHLNKGGRNKKEYLSEAIDKFCMCGLISPQCCWDQGEALLLSPNLTTNYLHWVYGLFNNYSTGMRSIWEARSAVLAPISSQFLCPHLGLFSRPIKTAKLRRQPWLACEELYIFNSFHFPNPLILIYFEWRDSEN